MTGMLIEIMAICIFFKMLNIMELCNHHNKADKINIFL